MLRVSFYCAMLVLLQACNSGSTESGGGVPLSKTITTAQCTASGGQVIGDPGDGRTQEPDFLCPSGQPPLGAIVFGQNEPIATEGAVCCS